MTSFTQIRTITVLLIFLRCRVSIYKIIDTLSYTTQLYFGKLINKIQKQHYEFKKKYLIINIVFNINLTFILILFTIIIF